MINARCRRWVAIGGFGLLLISGTLAFVHAASAVDTSTETSRIATAVIANNAAHDVFLRERIFLDPRFVETPLERARLIWYLDGAPLSSDETNRIERHVRQGAVLIIVGEIPKAWTFLSMTSNSSSSSRTALQGGSPLDTEIVWESAPQIADRWSLRSRSGKLVRAWAHTQTEQENIVGVERLGSGSVAVIGLSFAAPANRDFLLWPYFNYFLYRTAITLIGEIPETYAAWNASPIPQKKTMWIGALLLAFGWAISLALFFKARRYSKAHPETLTNFFLNRSESSTRSLRHVDSHNAWLTVGFSRPLAGFLTLTATLFLLFAPFYWLTNVLLPNTVQPFPQAKGIWDFTWEALQVAWFLFDAGTFVAFVKYFSEFRAKDPDEAVRSAQFFVWWQILTGLIQVSLAMIAALFILPHTRYGYSSSFVILAALGQYPGCFGVLTFFFQAYQRFDYNIALDLLSDWLLRFLLQIPCVLFFRAWGAAHPEYGEALGAAIGIGVGFYLSTIVSFLFGVVLYRRIGLRLLPLFLVHFDRQTAKRLLNYGMRVVSGQAFYRAAKTIERVVISLLLINYTEWLGLESQIYYHLMFLIPIAYRFFETAMSALSESYGNQKEALTQYYVNRFLQFGFFYATIGVSFVWALGPTFVRYAMDPQWQRAADYLTMAALIGVLSPAAWLSDMLQKAAGRPGLFAIILAIEQTVRISLFTFFIPIWQFRGFYFTLLFTLLFKVIGGWLVNHWLILRLRLNFWQIFVAPLLTGLVNFSIWRLVDHLQLSTDRTVVTVLFFVAAAVSFFICFFVYGLVGGFDEGLADELDRASQMTGPLKPLTRLFYRISRRGWLMSPLYNRFPLRMRDDALREAHEIESQIAQR